MSNPPEYELDDFLADESFRQWVRTGGHRDAAAPWSVWLAENPAKRDVARQAQRLLLAAHVDEEIPTEAETDAFLEQTWARVREAERPVVPLWGRAAWRVAAAVALLLLAGLGWWRWQPKRADSVAVKPAATAPQPAVAWRERLNDGQKPLVVALEDGSSVVLAPGSRLRFPAHFDPKTRDVTLEGEGFFEVAKNPAQPFLVRAGALTARVVGTSFRVRAYAAEHRVTVVVKTGQVVVFEARSEDGPTGRRGAGSKGPELMLTPNQSAVFRPNEVRPEARLVRASASPNAPRTLAVERQSFEFIDAPVPRILRAIEAAYGVTIEYDEAALARCQLTTSLADEPLYQKLAILAEALGNGSRFEAREGRLLLRSRGCE
jgi:ferric-dicitrate binding protein FerR (iron transport regulator)